MDGADAIVWFLGDLNDPWVGNLLNTIRDTRDVREVPCAGELPDRPFDANSPPDALILHRWRLTQSEARSLERWRPTAPASRPRLALCYGPLVRYTELERCSRFMDLLIPEATAGETLPRQIRELLQEARIDRTAPDGRSARVDIVSSDRALGSVLADACSAAGYRTAHRLHPSLEEACEGARGSAARVVTVWDVPVLEPWWPRAVAELCRGGPVIVLLGFATRTTVRLAREHGAAACLDVPLQIDDLVHVVDRVVLSMIGQSDLRAESAHVVPPAPAGRHERSRAAVRGPEPGQDEWPLDARSPRMPS